MKEERVRTEETRVTVTGGKVRKKKKRMYREKIKSPLWIS
jgi:hypothetical protein